MAVLNINEEPTQGVVLLDPETGQPTLPGRTSLTLEAALMLFPTKGQLAAKKPEVPSYAFLMPANHAEACYVYYGQQIPLRTVESGGDSITVSNNVISLKAGKTYKLRASMTALYPNNGGAFAWTSISDYKPIGATGGFNASPGYWESKGDAVAVITPPQDMQVCLRHLCPWSAYSIFGGNEWEYWLPAGSWITVEEMK